MANTTKGSGRTTPRSARSRTSLKQKPNEDYDPYANRELAEPVRFVLSIDFYVNTSKCLMFMLQ